MSSVGQVVGGVVGGVIGFFSGYGPVGALYGFQIGAGIGGVIDPPVVQGQKAGDLAKQSASEGGARAIVYGTARPIGGNVIATTEPIIRKKKQSGGKGGPDVKTEEVSRTYAIGACEGPITGFRRIWRDGKLVYFSGSAEFAANNAKFLETATLYNGTFDQMPDATLQGALGVDNVTPFRGTAYMVQNNENLTSVAGRIPQWTFEPVRSEGFVVTSRPYPVEATDSIQANGPVAQEPNLVTINEGVDQFGPVVLSASLNLIVLPPYEDGLPESIDQSGPNIISGVMYEESVTIIEYTDGEEESIDQSGPTIVSGTLDTIVLEYEEYPPESIDQSGPNITGGSLT